MTNPISNQLPLVPFESNAATFVSESEPEIIGEGGAAVVVSATDPKTGSPIARKKFTDVRYARSEVEALLGTQNVLHRMQWRRCQGKELDLNRIFEKNVYEAYLKWGLQFEMDEIESIAYQLLEFCDGMEKAGFVHGDLSPDNLIWEWTSRKLTVIDFGASHKIGSSPKFVTTTSFRYASPELILGKEKTTSYDLWSVGCVLYELITGKSLCDYKNLSSVEECYQYILQQIVSQIGTPSDEFLKQCKRANKCFDEGRNLVLKWKTPETVLWQDEVNQSLVEKNTSPEKIDQWINLLGRLFSYENRGSASEHLQSSLFSSEIKVELAYRADLKCTINICRASTYREDGEFDVSIDLHTQKDHRCIHIPRDPSNLYEIFVTDGVFEEHSQVVIQSKSLDVSTLQEQLIEESSSSSSDEKTN